MNGFDEAWLRSYNQRRAAAATPVSIYTPASIKLKLRRPTVTLNVLMRMHWRARGKLASSMSAELARQIPGAVSTLERALVTITRYSAGEPDYDGAVGGAKIAIDCLLPFSRRHPHGLGLVRDDSPQHMMLKVVTVVVDNLSEQRTEILIEPYRL